MKLPWIDKKIKNIHFPRRQRTPRPFSDIRGSFGEMQDVQQKWDLSEKDAYVRQHGRRRIPRIMIPITVFLSIIALLFWLLPGLVARYSGQSADTPGEVTEPIRLYDDSTRAVCVYAANLLSAADIKSDRVSQVLYNEPLILLDEGSPEGFLHVCTQDGLTGYVKTSDVTAGCDAIEPNLHKYKLIVSDMSKNVMSHANNGTLLVQVMMNTVLYADVKSDGVYQVALPDGEEGWISSSGVIELGVNDPVEKVGVRYFVSSVLSFVNAVHIDHGLTMRGLSVEGLAYISASVNGITLPRTMEGQMAMGQRVDLVYDAVTGVLDVTGIAPGDLVFFRDPNDSASAAPYEMGICTDTGTLIMTTKSRTALQLVTLSDDEVLEGRIIAVRRIFG